MKPNDKVLKEVITSLTKSFDDELHSTPAAELDAKYWHFKWAEDCGNIWNTYAFYSALKLYSSFCRRWEEHHNGSCCVVERVRDKYLMPKIRTFVVTLAARLPDPAAPVPELLGSFPVVLYFGNDADREEFIAIAKEAKPNMTARKI